MQRKTDYADYADDENVLLYNKPDKGGVIPWGIALVILLLFFIPFSTFILRTTWYRWEDTLVVLVFLALPGYLIFNLIYRILWEWMGEEKVCCTGTQLRIRQKVPFTREYVIPLNSIMDVVPYDEPLIYAALPTRDPCVIVSYKTGNNKIRKVYFGYHLSQKQQENLVEDIRELLLKSIA
ncbi:MAG: hypothetical protein K5890_06030 [Bacteroidales bacterium]|nr:hypothetical protein [Bacteroidales bacterium]